MYSCVYCNILACSTGEKENLPANCPMRNGEVMTDILEAYGEPGVNGFFIASAEVEAQGYCEWPRLRETIEICKKRGYKKIGIAFCMGLKKEAGVVADLFRKNGFEVVSVICKTGGIPKEDAGIPSEKKIHPDRFEPMCNPIAQARLLNAEHTDFNVEIGLCVGHDSLFYKYSDALVTTLVAKDRVLANNPCAAIYCADGYCEGRLGI